MKPIIAIHDPPAGHWVGDGFPVRSLFSPDGDAARFSPFLLLDRAGPYTFAPSDTPRGVGVHPHRGFETVTLVHRGEVAHRDSTGGGGVIGPGEVQWMTAGDGILHEEMHTPAFTARGGVLDMVQLWVNLPAAHERTAPRYQALARADIPVLALPHDAGEVQVVAGAFDGATGPARTFSPLDVWTVALRPGGVATLTSGAGRTFMLAVLEGTLQVNGEAVVREAGLVLFDRSEGEVQLEAAGEARVLVLGGEPLADPVVGYGPFVMSSRQGIAEAIDDWRNGRFGSIPPRMQ